MTQSPTITEFQTTVREAFDYLAHEFGCREIEPPRKDVAVSPFLVCFANATTLVQVEGTNYGFGAEVIVGPAASWKFWQSSVPLWAIIQHRRPELCDQVFSAPGQLGQLRAYAQVLREVASDVLKGDFAVFGPARTIIAAQMARDRRSEKDETRRHYHQVAVRRAGDAFRAKDFAQVVELLTPHLALLTPAERAKLDYARRHLGRRP